MKENTQHALRLTYGPREDEAMKVIDQMVENKILPESRNEILRRSIHCSRYLAEIDERPLLELLSRYLHQVIKNHQPEDLAIAKNLSFAIFAARILKYGLLRTEMFETIPMNLKLIEQIGSQTKDRNKFEIELEKGVGELATSVDTIFLKPLQTSYSQENLGIRRYTKAS